jgi:ATP synthase F1 epsilon subunit
MAKTFSVSIITPEKQIYQGKAVSLVVPAALGYLGVLADHDALAANLVEGKIVVSEESGKKADFYSLSKGFLQVLKNNVTLLLDGAK